MRWQLVLGCAALWVALATGSVYAAEPVAVAAVALGDASGEDLDELDEYSQQALHATLAKVPGLKPVSPDAVAAERQKRGVAAVQLLGNTNLGQAFGRGVGARLLITGTVKRYDRDGKTHRMTAELVAFDTDKAAVIWRQTYRETFESGSTRDRLRDSSVRDALRRKRHREVLDLILERAAPDLARLAALVAPAPPPASYQEEEEPEPASEAAPPPPAPRTTRPPAPQPKTPPPPAEPTYQAEEPAPSDDQTGDVEETSEASEIGSASDSDYPADEPAMPQETTDATTPLKNTVRSWLPLLIGIAIGGFLLLLAAVGLLVWLVRRRKGKPATAAAQPAPPPARPPAPPPAPALPPPPPPPPPPPKLPG